MQLQQRDQLMVDITASMQGDEVVVCVQDEGPEFSQEDKEHALDPWHWEAKKREGHRPGLGLGLFLSQAIIQQHGERIRLKSAPGHASHVSFSLPTTRPAHFLER